MDNRIIELAIEALEKRKAAVETEIAGLISAMSKQRERVAVTAKAGPRRSQSERMKAYWARKRAEKAMASQPVKARGALRKSGPQSAAARKASSERMKAYWAKRKAAKVKGPKQAKA